MFDARFEVLRYDLTSTYFECVPPEEGQRTFGYSRDQRSACVQVVIALIVTPEGFPLAYAVVPGNTSDKTTLADFLQAIERQYGKALRVWLMARGIPTEATLAAMRHAETLVSYWVGTPQGRLSPLEQRFHTRAWEQVREAVDVKLLESDGEIYLLARSHGRVMRRRRLKRLWKRLGELQQQTLTRDQLLLKLGAAKKEAGRAYGLIVLRLPEHDQPVNPATFTFALNRQKLRPVRQRECHYRLRSNLSGDDPAQLWTYYIQLTEIEPAFKELKGDLAIRPIYHQTDERIEAHLFVAFLAYCLQVTLKYRRKALALGLTPRAVLEKFATLQRVDVHLPTTDGRTLILTRYTAPEQDHQLLLTRLKLTLPQQPPPRITSAELRQPA